MRTAFAAGVVMALVACSADAGPASPSPSPSPVVTPEPAFADGIYGIECDSMAHTRPSAVTVLNDEVYGVGGWNHITGVGVFETAALPVSAYRITAENYVADPECAGARVLSVVLAKRTWDWDRNHANGMEASFQQQGLTFGDVKDVTLELRLDADRTAIPSAEDLDAAYGEFISAEDLAQLDGQQVNLELTLFGTTATATDPHMNASVMVALDPAEFADGWVRVKIPREDLSWYTEDNYVRTAVGSDEHQHLAVQGLRINPETASGQTVRHFAGEDFDPQARQDLLKEMAMTFALIEVGRTEAS